MTDRLAKLRQENLRLKQGLHHDTVQDSGTLESQNSSKNSDSHLSPRSTNASRLVTDESANGTGQY